jgi:elongation factor 1-beta
MATVVVTVKLMPDSSEINLEELYNEASEKIAAFGGDAGKKEIEPIAFGLKALIILFTLPEEKGSTEDLEKQLAELSGVSSVQVTDVRRTLG